VDEPSTEDPSRAFSVGSIAARRAWLDRLWGPGPELERRSEGGGAVRQLLVLGTGPAAAKSCVCIGLCRALWVAGVRVAPFKAVAVLRRDEVPASADENAPGLGAWHTRAAAGVPELAEANPVTVLQDDERSGRLSILGEPCGRVHIRGRDSIRMDLLPASIRDRMRAAIQRSYENLCMRFEALVLEGAGSPVDTRKRDDLSNLFVARQSGAPMLLTSRFSQGGVAAGLIGTAACLPEALRPRLLGYILSDAVQGDPAIEYACQQVERLAGLPSLGVIPPVMHSARPGSSADELGRAYEAWACAVREHVAPELLHFLESDRLRL